MKNKFLFSVFVYFIILVLISLGSWQLYRLSWKLDLIKQIEDSLKNKPVELFNIEENIKEFIQKIKTHLPEIQIERIDERFTSKIARNYLNTYSSKQKIRRKKENLDKVSASLILQSYLERK